MKNPCPTCSTYFRGNKLPLCRHTQRARFQHFSPENLFIDLCAQTVAIRNVLPAGCLQFYGNQRCYRSRIYLSSHLSSPLFFFSFSFFPLSPLFIRDIRHLFTTGNKFSSLMHSCSRVIYPNVSCNNIVPTYAGLQYY